MIARRPAASSKPVTAMSHRFEDQHVHVNAVWHLNWHRNRHTHRHASAAAATAREHRRGASTAIEGARAPAAATTFRTRTNTSGPDREATRTSAASSTVARAVAALRRSGAIARPTAAARTRIAATKTESGRDARATIVQRADAVRNVVAHGLPQSSHAPAPVADTRRHASRSGNPPIRIAPIRDAAAMATPSLPPAWSVPRATLAWQRTAVAAAGHVANPSQTVVVPSAPKPADEVRSSGVVRLDPAAADRLAEDVLRRVERQLRIERERRGL